MTDKDIIKALECCGNDGEITICSICPYYLQDRYNDFCQEDLHRASLDLINRQKAEIERLERHTKMHDEIKAEAIKEFAERLRKKIFPLDTVYSDGNYPINAKAVKVAIDNLVKEMVGDNE